jgi:serine O-acetyltransferase
MSERLNVSDPQSLSAKAARNLATAGGALTIGKGSTIGGNVWLTQSVPAGSNVLQAQMRHTNTLTIEPKQMGQAVCQPSI